MSKFNTTIKSGKTKTTNLAGGQAYKQSYELELVSILLTSFVKDSFYEKSSDTLSRLKMILSKVDPLFAAKAAIFARDKFGMRSITHALAGELASYSSGMIWSKDFYDKVVVRPDDMTEIISYYLSNKTDKNSPKFPNSLKKGFAKAFNKFDNYQISKYKGENKEVKLIDIINLVHPVPTKKNSDALKSLVSGDLKNTQTWESMLSSAGQNSNNDEELSNNKAEVWEQLISERKLGYFALLRNLRNIISQAPDSVEGACNLLVEDKLIKSSRVLPFRFKTAYDEIQKLHSDSKTRKVLVGIDEALNKSVINVPKFDGETLVVIDVSGSMQGKPSEIASLFGAILAKSNNCDVMTFATQANYVNYNPNDSVLTIRDSFKFNGGGTNFHNIFKVANKSYKRIIILSDMQGWIGHYSPVKEFNSYKNRFSCDPYIYSWDLNGYGTMQFPESNVFALSGFSDKVFDIMKWLETDRNALINEIKSIDI
jgi:60 kDa SS-A/Ro ribonucleoprotein